MPARVHRWKDQLQLISNLWDTPENSALNVENVVFSLVSRFVASKLETEKLSPFGRKCAIRNWLEPFVIRGFIRADLIDAATHWLSICVTKTVWKHFPPSIGETAMETATATFHYVAREFRNISLRSHHNGNFNKYRVSGHKICFLLRFPILSTILDSSIATATNNNNNDEYFAIFHLVSPAQHHEPRGEKDKNRSRKKLETGITGGRYCMTLYGVKRDAFHLSP